MRVVRFSAGTAATSGAATATARSAAGAGSALRLAPNRYRCRGRAIGHGSLLVERRPQGASVKVRATDVVFGIRLDLALAVNGKLGLIPTLLTVTAATNIGGHDREGDHRAQSLPAVEPGLDSRHDVGDLIVAENPVVEQIADRAGAMLATERGEQPAGLIGRHDRKGSLVGRNTARLPL